MDALSPDAIEEAVRFLDERKLIDRKTRVLELGCGAGGVLIALAPRVRSADGVESSDVVFRRAIARTIRFSNVRLHSTELTRLGAIADVSVDLVLAVGSMPGVVQLGRDHTLLAFREVARCLRPGGRFVLFGFSREWDGARAADELEKIAHRTGFTVLELGTQVIEQMNVPIYDLLRG